MLLLLLSIGACKPPLYPDTAAPDTSDTPPGDSAGDSGDETGPIDDTGAPPTDADGDGYAVDVDCDDANADRYPGAPEALDGLDGDCDGVVDNGEVTLFAGATETQGDGTYFGAAFAAGETSVGAALVAVSAPGGTGKVLVYDGAALGEGAAEPRYRLERSVSGEEFGDSLLFAPLNGDVYADLVVCAPSAGSGSGAVYVVDGSRISSGGTGSVDTVGHLVEGDRLGSSMFGASVAVTDTTTWVGAPAESLARGAIYGFDSASFVRGTYTTADEGARVLGAGSEVGVGAGILAMDWDADGRSDLVVTAPGSNGAGFEPGAGRAFVFDADTEATLTDESDTTAATASFSGQVARAYLGHPIAADLDGDGHLELVLSSWFGPDLAERQVVAVDSGGTGELGAESVRLSVTGLADPPEDGPGVAAGDLDGDGKADLLVGDYGNSPGRVLVFGSSLTLAGSLAPSDATALLDGPALDDSFGSSLLALDVAGDGGADIIAGAPMYGNGAVFAVPSAF